MNILLDHCLPRRMKELFPSHDVKTAAEMSWEGLKNGKLLAEVAAQFDVFLTIDKNLKHEQNLATLPVAVIVLLAPSNRLDDVVPLIPAVEIALRSLVPRTLVELSR